MIKEKMEKFMRFILAIAVFISNFGYNPVVLAGNDEVDAEYTHGQIIDPVNSIGSTDNEGDVKLTKTVSATDTEGVYDVTITASGKHKEETQVTTAPIYTVVVLDTSKSMYNCVEYGSWHKCNKEVKYSSAIEGAKTFASSLLGKFTQAQLALVTFSKNADVKRDFASTNFDSVSFPDTDYGTNLAGAIKTATNLLLDVKKENNNAKLYMVILSDGSPYYYENQDQNHSEEATKAKNNGVEIFTIGYETTDEAEEVLTNVATDSDHFVKANSDNIIDSFNNIAGEIKVETPAGSDATVTDAIADGFQYVAGSANIEMGVNGKNVSFDIGDITDEGKTVSFQIEVNKDLETGLHRTNDFAKVVYTDISGEEKTVNLEDSSKVYWEQLKFNYKVNYREQGTNIDLIKSKEVNDAIYGRTYSEVAETIKGYNLVEGTNNPSEITITEDNQELTFYYIKKADLTYTVKYLEEGTNKELAQEKTVDNQTYLDSYKEEAINIVGYNVVGTGIDEGVINSENLVITFYYNKKSDLTYIIDYFKDDQKVSNDSDNTYENMTYGSLVTLEDINSKVNKYKTEGYFDGVVETNMPLEIQDGENRIVVRYTRRNDLTYTVKYLEEGTNKELDKEKTVGNQTFLSNYSEIAKEITGYNVVGEATKTGTIDSEDLVITFYYTKKTDLSYTVRYLEEGTEEVLAEEKVVPNQTFLDSYTETAKTIPGYNVVGTGVEEGVINSENLVVTFYYTKKTDLTYIIDYFRDDVKVSNDEDDTYGNMTFGQLVKIEDISSKVNKYKVEGYQDGVVETEMPIEIQDGENRIVVRYTKRTDLSYTVKYLEEGTEEVLAEEKVVPNQTFLDSYTETAKTIPGYNVVGTGVEEGVINSENLVVTFYYTLRNDLSYRVEYYFDDVINDEMTKYYENIEFGTVIKDYDKIDVDGYEFVKDSGSIVVDVDTDNVIKVYYESVEIEAPQTGIDLSNDNNYLQMLALILLSSVGIILTSKKLLEK